MPEIKNTFLQSKMNKDLDARILPNGQYRDAQNVSVSRSEGADVGALENVLGNTLLTDLKTSLGYLEESKVTGAIPGAIVLSALEVIGYFMDVSGDRIFLFLTDYRDSSNDQLSNFAPADIYNGVNFVAKGAACYIVQYNISSKISRVLVGGNFLNFSKTHPILNVNLLEDLLFWTDNRNQPRKINVEYAFNNSYELNSDPYYSNEDHVSVAKYAPFSCMEFIDSSNNSTLISKSEEFLPAHVIDYISAIPAATPPRSVITLGGSYTFGTTTSDLYGNATNGDKLIVISQPETEYTVISATSASVTVDPPLDSTVDVDDTIKIFRRNPDYDDEFIGDPNLLKDEFAKFSYRFKYDDDEYSLMAPFTQAAYVPNQFGYFINDDETITAEAGDVQFMRNRVDNVKLQITLPELASQLERKLKVKEVQILIKNSDEQAVRVIEDVPIERIVDQSGASTSYVYDYLSTKAIKVLPEAELIRVHDKVPVKAMTQEVIANRVVYGNFVDKHSSPDYLDYELAYQTKGNDNFTTEFPMHTVKQNRSYQVGIVLVDRYGRASNVILNDETKVSSTGKNSTIYTDYENFGGNSIEFWGNNLALGLLQEIPATLSKPGYPGLYSETNPLGYYTYRIVIKQQEQDYYNVYVPGALAGELLWDVVTQWKLTSGTGTNIDFENDVVPEINSYLPNFVTTNKISMINLFGDNINKVPRELKTSSNANDDTFGSDTLLFNRVNPVYDTTEGSYNKQSAVSKTGEKVISIEPFKNLGEWTTTKGNGFPFNAPSDSVPPQPFYPYFAADDAGSPPYILNFHDIFFNAQANPFIATIETDFKIGATPEYTNTVENKNDAAAMKTAKDKIERAWQDLGVFETKPNKSVLDIYWETSSSDLISVLNSEPTSDLPAGFLDTVGNNTAEGDNLDYNHFEDDAIGTDITAQFQLVNNLGNPLSTFPTLTLQSVVDGSLNNRTSEFSLFSPSAGNFRLRTAAEFVYNSNANVLENYTFNFLATDSASTPTYTNVPVQLTNCSLQNIAPNWVTQPNPSYTITVPTYPSYPLFIFSIQLGSVENGSANSNRDTEEIVYTVIDAGTNPGNGAGDFEILSNTPNFALYAKESVFIGSGYSLKIRATDANGNGLFTDSNTFTVVLST